MSCQHRRNQHPDLAQVACRDAPAYPAGRISRRRSSIDASASARIGGTRPKHIWYAPAETPKTWHIAVIGDMTRLALTNSKTCQHSAESTQSPKETRPKLLPRSPVPGAAPDDQRRSPRRYGWPSSPSHRASQLRIAAAEGSTSRDTSANTGRAQNTALIQPRDTDVWASGCACSRKIQKKTDQS